MESLIVWLSLGVIVFLIVSFVKYIIKLTKTQKRKENEEKEMQAFRDQLKKLHQKRDHKTITEVYSTYNTDDIAELEMLAIAFFETGNPEIGEKIYMKALAKSNYENKNKLRLNLGKCWYNAKDYKKAIQYFQEIKYEELKYSFLEGDYEVPLLTGSAYYHLGRYEAAIEAFKKAPINKKEINKELNEIISLIGESYEALGNKKMAIKFYNKALSNDITLIELEEKIERLEGMEA